MKAIPTLALAVTLTLDWQDYFTELGFWMPPEELELKRRHSSPA